MVGVGVGVGVGVVVVGDGVGVGELDVGDGVGVGELDVGVGFGLLVVGDGELVATGVGGAANCITGSPSSAPSMNAVHTCVG